MEPYIQKPPRNRSDSNPFKTSPEYVYVTVLFIKDSVERMRE